MIIDKILDRKDGQPYNAGKFYRDCRAYGDIGNDIVNALDSGTEEQVKSALCAYVIENEYRPAICNYINRVTWLTDDVARVPCDDHCGAKEEPQTYEEALATVAHYKSHGYLSGCSHGN